MKTRRILLASASCAIALAMFDAAQAQQAAPADQVENVTVTGSRVITNGNDSPTPVTIVTADQLLAAHPTTVFEALTDLPVFASNISALTAPKGGSGSPPNVSVLNLRDIGAARSLILYDGHRVPTTTQTGLVDVSTIPQLLLQRVDVVTGGASAVYGSDAIAGVVNFITNRKFDGIKANFQYGIATHGDDPSDRLAIAGGMDLFDGRGHIEGSVEERTSGGVLKNARPNTQQYTLQGSGTTALPFFLAQNALTSTASFGGKIIGPANNPLLNQEFSSNGVLTPFVNGFTAGLTSGTQLGGSGFLQSQFSALQAKQDNRQAYGRFDFDVNEDTHFYATVSATRAHSLGLNTTTNTTVTPTLSATNAFLPAQYQAALAAAHVTTFTIGKAWLPSQLPTQSATFNTGSLYINTGLEGKLFGDYRWEASFTHGLTTLHSTANADLNQGKLLAALDAVKDPATGNIVCNVTLTNPGLYPGCVPLNTFGPTAGSAAANAYVVDPRTYLGQTTMDDASGSISGSPFSLWAGPVNLAVSGEWRELGYKFTSNAPTTATNTLDCTGLRFCTAGLALFIPNNVASRSPVSQDITEGAIEADVPVAKDLWFIDAADLNMAARYAEYTTTGALIDPGPVTSTKFSAFTWKAGLDVHIGDAITLRSSRSRDIRAPNLNDLFAPSSVRNNPTNDLLTLQTSRANIQSGGNPHLTPEKADTTTAGVVFKPEFLPDFSVALDYFNIDIKNAITTVDGTSASIQNACYLSAGSSFYCSTQTRALGSYTNTSPANAVTVWFQEPLNIAEQTTEGVDFEANYKTTAFDQPLTFRLLSTYQPSNNLAQPNANTLYSAGVTDPVWRTTGFIHYDVTEMFGVDWETRWRSAEKNADPRYFVVAPGSLRVSPATYSNVTLSYRIPTPSYGEATVYVNVQNLFNAPPAVTSGFVNGDDPIGRYFNFGLRYQY